MKAVLGIYAILVITFVGGLVWANNSINELIHQTDWQPAYIDCTCVTEPLTIVNDGYNSATDALQTAAGVFTFQRADYGTEFIQGSENNAVWVIQ